MPPPFFVPIFGFILWFLSLVFYLPVLGLGLHLSDQFLGAHFFVAYYLILISWPLSGPLVAAVLSFFFSSISVYLCLADKEPAYLAELLFFSTFFIYMAFYLQTLQRLSREKRLSNEKLAEDLHVARQTIAKKYAQKEALEHKIKHFLNLERFAEDLKRGTDLSGIARRIVTETHEMIPAADECVLYLVDEEKQELSFLSSAPARPEDVLEKKGQIFDLWVMKRAQAVLVDDTRDDFRFAMETKPDLDDWRSVCASPLVSENRVLGVLRANSFKVHAFNDEDLRLLDIFGNFGAVNLRNALLLDRMQRLASHDGLTGLFVNRVFRERLSEALAKSSADKGPFGLVLLDIDHFKRYNDTYGHAAGDLVLRQIGALLASRLGPEDLGSRYGGEEFAVLLAGRGKKEALGWAQELRAAIASLSVTVRRTATTVTASLGAAVFPEDGKTAEALLQAADARLYEAKRKGRNRVYG